MTIFLLTHQKELERKTNTGSLVVEVLGDRAKVISWERLKQDAVLSESIAKGSVALLYPKDDSTPLTQAVRYESYIVLDGTWQEAQKIYNKSPYLQTLPALKIETDSPSLYTLRRNQKQDGLCTAEIVIEVLKNEMHADRAETLRSKLVNFLSGEGTTQE